MSNPKGAGRKDGLTFFGTNTKATVPNELAGQWASLDNKSKFVREAIKEKMMRQTTPEICANMTDEEKAFEVKAAKRGLPFALILDFIESEVRGGTSLLTIKDLTGYKRTEDSAYRSQSQWGTRCGK